MSESSQIYIRYIDNTEKNKLIARDFSWNYGERMISRTKHLLDYICYRMENSHYFIDEYERLKIERLADVNFDMCDVQISRNVLEDYKEYGSKEELYDYIFGINNNNGVLLIDVDVKRKIVKYALLTNKMDDGPIMDANSYILWNGGTNWTEYLSEKEVETCKNNIARINELAKVMTMDEVEIFLNLDTHKK